MPYLTPNATDYDEVCRVVVIPAGFAAIVMGALDELTRDWNWEKFGSIDVADAVIAMQNMIDAAYGSDCSMTTIIYPDEFTILWADMRVKAGNPLQTNFLSTQPTGTYWKQITSAIDDQMECDVTLAEGTYSFDLHCLTTNISGVAHLIIDGVDVGTVDLYSSSVTPDQVKSVSAAITPGGAHTIGFKMHTKNASSTNYQAAISWLHIRRTGD